MYNMAKLSSWPLWRYQYNTIRVKSILSRRNAVIIVMFRSGFFLPIPNNKKVLGNSLRLTRDPPVDNYEFSRIELWWLLSYTVYIHTLMLRCGSLNTYYIWKSSCYTLYQKQPHILRNRIPINFSVDV